MIIGYLVLSFELFKRSGFGGVGATPRLLVQ